MIDKRYDEAAALLEFMRESYPDISAIVDILAQCYLQSGRPQEAIVILQAELDKHPQRIELVKKLGLAYLDLGERDKAVEVWNGLLDDDERKASNYGIVARIEQDAGLYEEALATLREGRKFKKHFSSFTMDIVRLEQKLGRDRSAFRNSVIYLSLIKNPRLDQARFAVEIFRDAGSPPDLISVVDSVVVTSPKSERFLRRFEALLFVEAGSYGEAAAFLDPVEGKPPDHRELFEFVSALSRMSRGRGDDEFNEFFHATLERFHALHGNSPIAPAVLLLTASLKRELALKTTPPDGTLLYEVIALTDSIVKHPQGRNHKAKAMLLKALVLMDDLHMPAEALETIELTRWRNKETYLAYEELRMRALFASGRWEQAEKRLSAIAKHGDSTYAVLGHYGLGRLYFFTGRYDSAVSVNSELAEKYSWSEWANDALETAMIVKAAMNEGGGSLALYSGAILSLERGEFDHAIDSLIALERRHPASVVLPRSMLLRAALLVEAGRGTEAETVLESVAEKYPLHEAAPRALEFLGEIIEDERPLEAVHRYSEIIERYPKDPFLDRVRNRYIALQKTFPESGEADHNVP